MKLPLMMFLVIALIGMARWTPFVESFPPAWTLTLALGVVVVVVAMNKDFE